MLNEKFLEVLKHPSDGIVAIVTEGTDEPHVVNTWNSFVKVNEDDKLLLPVGGMKTTEKNVDSNNRVKLTIGSREVQGLRYKGTGYLLEGTANFLYSGPNFDLVKESHPWVRAALEITIESMKQTQ